MYDEIMNKAINRLLDGGESFSCHCIKHATPIRDFEAREVSYKMADLYAKFISNYLGETPETRDIIPCAIWAKYGANEDEVPFRLKMLKDFQLALTDGRVDYENNKVNELCTIHDNGE